MLTPNPAKLFLYGAATNQEDKADFKRTPVTDRCNELSPIQSRWGANGEPDDNLATMFSAQAYIHVSSPRDDQDCTSCLASDFS